MAANPSGPFVWFLFSFRKPSAWPVDQEKMLELSCCGADQISTYCLLQTNHVAWGQEPVHWDGRLLHCLLVPWLHPLYLVQLIRHLPWKKWFRHGNLPNTFHSEVQCREAHKLFSRSLSSFNSLFIPWSTASLSGFRLLRHLKKTFLFVLIFLAMSPSTVFFCLPHFVLFFFLLFFIWAQLSLL